MTHGEDKVISTLYSPSTHQTNISRAFIMLDTIPGKTNIAKNTTVFWNLHETTSRIKEENALKVCKPVHTTNMPLPCLHRLGPSLSGSWLNIISDTAGSPHPPPGRVFFLESPDGCTEDPLFPPPPKQGSPQSAGSTVKCASFIFHHDKG